MSLVLEVARGCVGLTGGGAAGWSRPIKPSTPANTAGDHGHQLLVASADEMLTYTKWGVNMPKV